MLNTFAVYVDNKQVRPEPSSSLCSRRRAFTSASADVGHTRQRAVSRRQAVDTDE